MRWLKQRARFGGVAALVAAVLALPVLLASPAAAASSGDWGWGARTFSAPAGSTYVTGGTYPRLPCHSTTCTYDSSMLFEAAAQNGTTITTPVGTTTDFVNGTTGAVMGTCTVTSTTTYFCQSNSSGSVSGPGEAAENSLHGSGNLNFSIPADQAQGSVAVHYSWSEGAPEGEPNDTIDMVVSGTVSTPLVNFWVAGGGAAGLLVLLAAGYALYRRRRTDAPLPNPA